MWNFKGTLSNSTQHILPIHWKIRFLYNIGILRALRFKSSYAFLKHPPDPYVSQTDTVSPIEWQWEVLAGYRGEYEHKKYDTPYLTCGSQVWSVFCEIEEKLSGHEKVWLYVCWWLNYMNYITVIVHVYPREKTPKRTMFSWIFITQSFSSEMSTKDTP